MPASTASRRSLLSACGLAGATMLAGCASLLRTGPDEVTVRVDNESGAERDVVVRVDPDGDAGPTEESLTVADGETVDALTVPRGDEQVTYALTVAVIDGPTGTHEFDAGGGTGLVSVTAELDDGSIEFLEGVE